MRGLNPKESERLATSQMGQRLGVISGRSDQAGDSARDSNAWKNATHPDTSFHENENTASEKQPERRR